MRKEKIFIDIDGVLLNTSLLRDQFFESFIRAGYQIQDIKTTFMLESMDYQYNPIKHLDRLQKIKHTNQKLAEARIKSVYTNIYKYLYEDVKELLVGVDKEKYELNILTLGDIEFQNKKIDHSEIANSIDNIHIADSPKQNYLDKLVGNKEEFVLIDDRADILEKVRKKFAKSLCIQIIRQDLEIADATMMYKDVYSGIKIKSLPEAFKYLQW